MPKASQPESGLPASIENERVVLGSVFLDESAFGPVSQVLKPDDFVLQKHQIIFQRMLDLQERGVSIDRVTVANELSKRRELDGIGGLTYLTELDNGLPQVANPGAYASIVKEKSRLRQYVFAARGIARDAMAGTKLSGEIFREAQADLAKIGDGTTGPGIQTPAEFIRSYPGGISTMLDPSKWKPGVPTGFKQLDEWTGGFHECEIFLIGARPGAGKTALAAGLAKSLGFRGFTSVFFSMEMSKEMLLQRMWCQEAGISVQRFRAGELLDDERKRLTNAVGLIADLPIHFDETSGLTVPEIGTKLQSIMNERPVALCAIDYVQLLRPSPGKRYQNENEMFTQIAADLQELAKRTKVPLLLLSQLNRDSEKSGGDRKPKLSQARGAGAWEQICNVGMCIYREYLVKKDRPDMENVAELLVDKNRSGPSGSIRLAFIGYLMRFSDAD